MEASRVGAGVNNKKRRTANKCHWTHEEDGLLTMLVRKHGPGNWSYIADHIKERTGMSCRLRWVNHLNPKVDKTPFSKEEQERLTELHRLFGNKWSSIVRFFPRRTDNQLKNQYHGLVGSRTMKVPNASSSTNHRSCRKKGSIDLSCDASSSKHAVGPQLSDVPQQGDKCCNCSPCLRSMPDATRMPLFRSGSSSTYGRDDTWFAAHSDLSRSLSTYSIHGKDETCFVDHFPSLSRNGAHLFESIDHGIEYANPGTSRGDSVVSDARSSRFSQCCLVAQHHQGANAEKYQFMDFLGVGNSE